MEMESSSKAIEQLGKLAKIKFHSKVAQIMKVNCYHDNGLLFALVDKCDPEDECFKVDGKSLFVGQEDVLRITGLKIQEKAITPLETYKAITRCETGARKQKQGEPAKYYRRHLASLNSLEYNETPYSRLNPDPLPDALKEQLEMKRYWGVLIHPIKRDFIHHRPELCLSRLGLVNPDLSQPSLKRENGQKARSYVKHKRQWNNFKEYLLEETGSGKQSSSIPTVPWTQGTRDDREQSVETRSGVGGNHIDYNSGGSDSRTRDDREPTEVQGDASGPKARKGIKRKFELDPNTPLCRSNRIKFISSSSPRGPPGRIDSSNETSGVESTSDGDESMRSDDEINRDDESMSNDHEDNDGKSLSNGDQVNMRSDELEHESDKHDQPLEVTNTRIMETAVDGLNEEDNDTGMMKRHQMDSMSRRPHMH
ncbi:hypothetical protein ACLB2K_000270 [Fragaria x ananassa]